MKSQYPALMLLKLPTKEALHRWYSFDGNVNDVFNITHC